MAFVCSHRFDTSRVMAIRPWSCQAHWLSPMDVGVYTYVHGMDYISKGRNDFTHHQLKDYDVFSVKNLQ